MIYINVLVGSNIYFMFYKKSRRVVVVVVVIPVLIVDFFISTCKVKSVHKEKTHPLQWLFELVGMHERSKKVII